VIIPTLMQLADVNHKTGAWKPATAVGIVSQEEFRRNGHFLRFSGSVYIFRQDWVSFCVCMKSRIRRRILRRTLSEFRPRDTDSGVFTAGLDERCLCRANSAMEALGQDGRFEKFRLEAASSQRGLKMSTVCTEVDVNIGLVSVLITTIPR
jgi:hypothetical protein